jgi:hypothetical protein
MQLALERSRAEGIPLHEAQRGLWQTPREFIELRSAMADVDDARAAAQRAAEFRRWEEAQGDSVDVSAPGPYEREQGARARANASTR